MKFKMGLAEAMGIAAGAGLGAVSAKLLGRLYVRHPMLQTIYGAYTFPAIVGFFIIAGGSGLIKHLGVGMMAYGVGKLVYNGIINLIERSG